MTSDSQRRRLLVLAPFPPRLDATHGGGRVVARLLQVHAERNRVVLLALRRPGEPPVDAAVAAACEQVHEVERIAVGRSLPTLWRERQRAIELMRGRPLWVASIATREFRARLTALCREWRPDVVQAELGAMAGYLALAPRPARRVLVEHDPGVRRSGSRLARWSWRRFVRESAAVADAVVVFSEQDLVAMRDLTPAATVLERISVPWQVRAAPLDPVGSEPPTVLFVGSFRHGPNVEAARRLVALLPELRRQRPDVVLAIVGEEPPAELAVEGVSLPGAVAELEPWLAAAAVVVAPVATGGGVRVKVVEALVAGKAVVGTRLAFEGLDVEDGREVVVADDDAAFVAALARLLDDPDRRRCLGAAARAWAERLPAPVAIGDSYEALYRRLEEH